jgi:Ser/Thr protein kinase RdoA (MazF antagonist)
LHEGVDDQGLYFFDMEYVRGLDGVSFLRNASLPEIERFTSALRACLERFASLKHDTLTFSPRQNAMAKCLEIAAALSDDDLAARRAMARLIDLVAKAEMPENLTVTVCHGDMTLENIVVGEDGTIVFIDLLDTFFNHWLADIAKLEQDLRAGWYTRKSPVLAAGIVSFVRGALRDFAQGQFEGAPQVVSLLVCVHLARILPYTRTAEMRQFVLARLELLLQQQTV